MTIKNVNLPYPSFFEVWSEMPLHPVTDAKVAAPLPDMPNPIYTVFVKGIGDHQVHGLRATGLQLIGGNKLTDSGLDSCTVTAAEVDDLIHHVKTITYRNILFLKSMADKKIYFNSFTTTSTVPM